MAHFIQLGPDHLGGVATGPIDPQLAAVARGLEIPGCKGREPQQGRAAEAPVRDQHRSALTVAWLGCQVGVEPQLEIHRIHGHTGQLDQGLAGQGQAEQRRHRRHQLMAQ